MSTFQGNISGRVVVPGTYTAAGGTTNFNFACQSGHDRSDQSHKPFSTVPFAPDPDFVDRPDIIAWVRDKCAKPGARAALVGLGGVGKSQLAIQHAHKVRDAAPNTYVFWVHASTRARFEEAYQAIAEKLQLLDHQDSKVDVLRLVSDWLSNEANGRWSMVIDNADDIETFLTLPQGGQDSAVEGPSNALVDYLPQSRNGSILITSRSRDTASRLAGGYHNIREVLAMDESQGLELLLTKLYPVPTDQSNAVELVRLLDHMPLAITQAAAYINRRARMTISNYIREFCANDERRESLLNCDAGDLRRDRTAANSVVTTWQMSFERIQHERPSAANLLSLMSFFNPQEIPETTLRNYARASAHGGTGDDLSKADSSFDEDLDVLYKYSLVTVLPDKNACEMHALVQFCTRVWLSSFSETERWRRRFTKLLAQEFPRGEYEDWEQCRRLFPHVEPLFDSQPECEETAKAWTEILTKAARYLCLKGSYEAAEAIAVNAMTARERLFGPDNLETLKSMDRLGTVLYLRGKLVKAEKLHRRALAGREKELGEHHPETITSMHNLAVVLKNLRKLSEADKLFQRALELKEKELGEHHLESLLIADNLALVLHSLGKYEEAENLHQRALTGREKELGEHHPYTLTSMHNLAAVLQNQAVLLKNQGMHEKAEELHRQVLVRRVKELGEHHPSTLTSMDSLALVLHNQGKYEEAEKLYRQALIGREKELGGQHMDTLISMHRLALVLKHQRKYEEAEKLLCRMLAEREKELGGQYIDPVPLVWNLAEVLWLLKRPEEALPLYQRAYDDLTQTLGPQHPKTIRCGEQLLAVQQEPSQAGSADNSSQKDRHNSLIARTVHRFSKRLTRRD